MKGFTLLEVLIAILIFAISITILLEIESNYIRWINRNNLELEALQFFKKYNFGYEPYLDEKFTIEKEVKDRKEGFKEIKNKIIYRKTGETILIIKTYTNGAK